MFAPNWSGLGAGLLIVWCLAIPPVAQSQILRNQEAPRQPVDSAQARAKAAAEQAYQQGDYQRTVDLASSVLRVSPRDAVALYLRGSALVEIGRARRDNKMVRNGIADARQAIAIGGTDQAVYYLPYLYGMTNLAALENRKSHADVALQTANQAIAELKLKPDEKANLLYQRALTHLYLKDFDAAFADYQQAIDLNPKHLGAYVGLADAYAAGGQSEKALAAFGEAIDAFPENPLVFNNRGMYLQQQGKPAEAVLDFTRAIEIEPNYIYAYTNRGYALLEQGDAELAEADFSASLRIARDQPMVYSLRATSRLAQGKVNEAIADYERIIELDPQNPIAHADLGFAKFFAKDYAAAQAAFARARELDPKLRFLAPWQLLAMEANGQGEAARQKFTAELEKEAEQRDWIDHLLAYLLGTMSEEELLKAAEPTNEALRDAQLCEAHFFIGRRQQQAGNTEAAAAHFQQALATEARQLSAYRGAQFALKKFAAADDE